MSDEHDSLRRLVLSYEDLEAAERAEADRHLAACEGCRTHLGRLREVEAGKGPHGSLPAFEGGESVPFRSGEAAQADDSLRHLRRRLGLDARRVSPVRSPGRRWLWVLAPAAVAATMVMLLLIPEINRQREGIHDLRAIPDSVPRGGTGEGKDLWRTGEGFRLRFQTTRSVHPVLFHMDPQGRVSLLHPEDPRGPVPGVAAGRTVDIPPRESPDRWVLEGKPGTETFLLVSVDRADADLGGLTRDLQQTADRSGDRRQKVGGLSRHLQDRYGFVRVLEMEHAP